MENSEAHMENSKTHMEDSEALRENSETNFENSETNMEQTSLNDDGATFKDTSSGLSFVNPSTQQVLETHLTRHLVRHRWILPLRGLKTVQLFNGNKPVALPSPHPPAPSRVCCDSGEDSIVRTASILGEPSQKSSEEVLTTKTASGTKTPPTALYLQRPNETPPNDNSWPSEAPSTIQKDNVTTLCTTHSLAGRDRLRDKVLGPWNDNPEPGSNLVESGCELRKSEGTVIDLSQGLSVQKIAGASQLATNRETRELEEEGFCDWALNTETREMTNSQANNGWLKGIESLQASEGQAPSQTISQDPEESTTGVILQECAPGICFQGCSQDVLLAADIVASQPSQTSFKTVSTTSKTSSEDMYPFLSRGGSVPKHLKPEKPWAGHILSPTDKKEDRRGPRRDRYLSEMRLAQAYRSDTHESNSSPLIEKTFGNRVKSFMKDFVSAVTTKSQVQENSLQKLKASAATPESQGSVKSRVFMAPQVAEGQGPVPSFRPVLQEKVMVGPTRTASKKSLHREPPQVSTGRHVCLHRSAIAEGNKAHGSSPKAHSQPSTDKWMDYNSQVQLCQEAVYRADACQHRVQPPCVPGISVHCPRHCLYRSELSRKAKAFPHVP